MSAVIRCPVCGQLKEVPAFEGDGVYHEHFCEPDPVDKVLQTHNAKVSRVHD